MLSSFTHDQSHVTDIHESWNIDVQKGREFKSYVYKKLYMIFLS